MLGRITPCLVALACSACVTTGGSGSTPPQERVTPERAAAKLRQSQARTSELISSLSAAVREQPRDEAWASAQERQLRQSFVEHPSAPKDALKEIDCRRSRCELRLQLAPESDAPPQASPQVAVIDQWIAWSQPCAYTLTHDLASPQATGTVRVFLECER